MSARALSLGACAVVVLLAAPALATGGGWTFHSFSTPQYAPISHPELLALIYQNDGTTVVKDGALVQVIIGLDGADIVDPLEHFDYDDNGAVEGAECQDMATWVQGGADPAAISGGTNVLAYGTLGFTGEFATASGGLDWEAPVGAEPIIANGFAQDKLTWRAWNLTKQELLKWGKLGDPEVVLGELWYTDGREYFSHENDGGGPDTGWWIGMPDMGLGGDVTIWYGFDHKIGAEIAAYYLLGEPTARSQNRLDRLLGTAIPEPGTMLVVGSGLVLLAARIGRKPSRAAR